MLGGGRRGLKDYFAVFDGTIYSHPMKTTAQILRKKISDLQKQLADLQSNKVANIKKVKALMQELGITVADITSASGVTTARRQRKTPAKRSTTGRRVPVKYQDGQGHSWSGRGKTPRWLVDAEATGKTREQFLVKR